MNGPVARWYARDVDFVSLNKAAITAVVPSAHEQALVMDASFVPKSGKSVHEMSSESTWRETRVSGCKGPSVHGRTLGTSAQRSSGVPGEEGAPWMHSTSR